MTPDNLRYGQKKGHMFISSRTYVHKLTNICSQACEHMFRKGAGSEQQGSKQALGLLLEQLRSSLGAGKEQLRSSLGACKVITSQGVCPPVSTRYYGHTREMAGTTQAFGKLMSLATTWLLLGYTLGTPWVHLGKDMGRVWVRYALLVLMMVVGVSEMWGQDTDYSGTAYIAFFHRDKGGYSATDPTDNFYLCPTKDWIYYQSTSPYYTATSNNQSFLTTFKYRSGATDPSTGDPYDEREAKWTLEYHETVGGTDYYYIRRNIDGMYLTLNGRLGNGSGANRLRVHIETTASPGDNHLFAVIPYTYNNKISYFVISPKNASTYYFTVHQGNFNALSGQEASQKNDGPTGYKNIGGTIGIYTDITDVNSPCMLEDLIQSPVVEQTNDNKIEISYPGTETVTLYYTLNGTKPDLANVGGDNPTQIYSGPITMSNPVITVKAIAVKTKGTGETLDTYSRCVTLTTQRYIGSSYPYMIQSVECTDFYMMPGDVSSGNTTVNTSSLFRSTMAWTFTSAGYEGGAQYFYIKNGTSYLFRSGNNIYIRSNSIFEEAADKTSYKFFIEQGYDADSNPDGYCIIPKGITNITYCLFKDGYNAGPPELLANANTNVVKCGNDARGVARGRWNIITYSAPGNVLPASLVTINTSNPTLFKIENVGTPGQYMNDASTVGTTTTGSDDLAWYIVEAGSDSERKYYYIVHKTGKYLKFNKATTVTNDQSNVLSLLDYDGSASDRYQFVFAKSTTDGAYYIVPKGLENVQYSQYYALYLDETNIKSNKNRVSDSYKWKFVPFCANPVFAESEGSITLSCATTGAEIHYTDDGTEPDENAATYSSSWPSSDPRQIKAIGVIKEGGEVVSKSEVVTLLNKPTITLESGSQVYDGKQKTPAVNSVKVGTTEAPKPPASPATYRIEYSNNINAGENTASVTIIDDINDNWYIWNVPTTHFTINKKMLTVTAVDKTVEYGHPAPEYTVTITGWENGEGLAVLETIPSATSDYPTDSYVGKTYVITPSGGVDNNYDFTYVNGTLTVAAGFVTLTANSGTVTYNGTEQTVSGFTCSVDGLTFTDVSASGSGTDAGNYDVTFTGVTENTTMDDTGYYVVTETEPGTLTIEPAAATVTAVNKTKTYGEADPELTATVTGLYGSDAITYTLSRTAGNNAGNYAITPTGETTQGNYTVSYVPGTFTINQKGLTITANNHSITYGDAPDNSGVTYSGFITGENENTEGVFTGTLVYDYNSANDGSGTSYTTTIPQGTFYIIPSGLTAQNYAITYYPGTLTVNKKSIGDGSIASSFTLSFGEGGDIILMDGETELQQGESGGDEKDFIISDETTSTSGRYSQRTVSGKGNYTGSFAIRNANVNFETDADEVEWSATFVAEPVGEVAADETKGHALPEGVRAYIITDIIGDWAIPEPLNYIPEGIPVLLLSDKESGGFLVKDASDHTAITSTQIDDNMLKVTNSITHFNIKTIYLLSRNEFVHNMPGDLAAGKVYLDPTVPTPSPSPAPSRLFIKWDAVTDINGITESGNAETRNDAWYTMDGRKLNRKPTQKGMYLVNGKKVIIK